MCYSLYTGNLTTRTTPDVASFLHDERTNLSASKLTFDITERSTIYRGQYASASVRWQNQNPHHKVNFFSLFETSWTDCGDVGLRTASACCWLCTFHCLTCFVQERGWGGRGGGGKGEGGRGKGEGRRGGGVICIEGDRRYPSVVSFVLISEFLLT